MVLITIISKNVVISFNRVIDAAVIEVEKIRRHKSKTFTVAKTNFTRIPVEEKGRYEIRVNLGDQQYSKRLEI